jgi:hypothetical protein
MRSGPNERKFREAAMKCDDPVLRHTRLAAILVALLACGAGVRAADTFTEPKGRFALDLPSGWSLQPQTDETVYVFNAGSESIIIQYYGGALGRETLFQNGMVSVRASLPTAEVKGAVLEQKVNGNPARWGVYRDTLQVGKTRVPLYGTLGSVVLKQGGLYFLAIMNEIGFDEKLKKFAGIFQSIRDPGGVLTRMVDEGKAAPPSAAVTAAATAPLKFSRRDVSIVFPAGWTEVDKSGQFEPEFLGWFESLSVPGATIIVYTYTGFTAGSTNLRIRGLKTIADAYPLGQEALKESRSFTTAKDRTAKLEVWRGHLLSGGAAVVKQSPMAILKTGRGGWLLMIGFAPDASGPWLEGEFTRILDTIE